MPNSKGWLVIAVLVLGLAGAALAFFFAGTRAPAVPEVPAAAQATTTHAVIGKSVEGRDIEAFTYGTGTTSVVFVGGIHGGYEWNSVLLAYQLMDYLAANPGAIPESETVTVIPDANPDGVFKIIGKEGRFAATDVKAGDQSAGRFNAHGVDLNRNFSCKWQATGTWQGKTVSAGTSAFSEPEAATLRDFFVREKPAAAIFFHSQANAVYASECEAGVLPATLAVMNAYAKAAGYPAVPSFDAYPVTGDIEGWLASLGVPAITVELSSHESVEWDRNIRGVEAVLGALAGG